MEQFDTIILGAGAAGMFCAGSILAAAKQRVLVIDHARAPGEKIRISGGGRCNFTNLSTAPDRFLSGNPRFSASALTGFSAQDFIDLVEGAGIAWHEKTMGQLFCDGSARQIIDMLLHRMRGAQLWLQTSIGAVAGGQDGFRVETSRGMVQAPNLVVATGGKSIPKMGATGLGYEIARNFGVPVVAPRPGLVPLTFAHQDLELCRPIAGLSIQAQTSHSQPGLHQSFLDGLLFTHRGLSGPAILQISSFWRPGDPISIDLAPGLGIADELRLRRVGQGRSNLSTVLAQWLPVRLAQAIVHELGFEGRKLAEVKNNALDQIGQRINRWQLRPVGSEGWRTAEVTVGGVDTTALDSRSMQARNVPGLFFIGEVVDVTGWLGGYNFQWAWASAHAAGKAISATKR
ncbi:MULTISPECIES: NAD(P)/FAD-dependent oxidoreductase [unclassified Paracoccus (in: a-proteobacteria)]|uniref:NAD(P)/FAD-dependent oxidoreductase n=1 Tax=unclassified Paracoccus (in: a-proteobacteria) TaxID=2688777 RepID=UPI0012B22A5E|nr:MULTISPECIES: NAD(P)/FAD-dependent oxidoreductase [unclassified Paracoccus (in: a-proteobacteria)]UXU74561.1 NAD(P)/FAD-dependent oxidoreductase [Paracoccus sp. SMMA_5]UXU80455.1 NAD(P)/FAD-dependent oxidoreductase [Paracoccus sp. SMMA_5_TC]